MLYCRFLYHKESAEYRYYEAQLCQAEAAKKGSAGPKVAAAAPYPGKATLISLQHRFTASLFQIMLSNHTPLWRLSCFLAMAPMVVLTLTHSLCAAQRPARSEEPVPSAAPASAVAEALNRIKRSSAGEPALKLTPPLELEAPCHETFLDASRDSCAAMNFPRNES